MAEKVVPMIRVPDVRAAVEWYTSIGFRLAGVHDEDGEMDRASLEWGETGIMLNAGGLPSSRDRRELDLGVETDDVEELAARLKGRVEVVEDLNDTFYGMRELIIRDLNRFWITFGQPLPGR
jgi:hypothetical protein